MGLLLSCIGTEPTDNVFIDMGEADRYQEYKHLRKKKFILGAENNALTTLLALNAIGFLSLLTLQVSFYFGQQSREVFYNSIVYYAELPALFNTFIHKPWTLLTFMFADTDNGLWRIVSNMVWMWTFGYFFQQLAGNNKLIPVYIYGGLMGGIAFMLAGQLGLQANTSLIGANASVLAIAGAAVAVEPSHRVLTHIRKGIPLWVLLLIYVTIDLLGVLPVGMGYVIAHVAGLFTGIAFSLLLRSGKDLSAWMNDFFHRISNLFTPTPNNNKNTRDTFFYKTGSRKPFEKSYLNTQQRLDEILDKINAKGYHSLTEEEKDFLQQAANEPEE